MTRTFVAAPSCCIRILLLLMGLVATGCGGGPSPVTGKVLHKGAPAKGALVVFHPRDNPSATAPRPTGAVQDDGSFTVETVRTPGVAPGRYGVTISWPGKPKTAGPKLGMSGGEKEHEGGADQLGGRYANADAPKFEVTIKSGKNVLDPFNLE